MSQQPDLKNIELSDLLAELGKEDLRHKRAKQRVRLEYWLGNFIILLITLFFIFS